MSFFETLCRIDPIHFLEEGHKRYLNQALVSLSVVLSMFVVLCNCYLGFCVAISLALHLVGKTSVLYQSSDWLGDCL